MKHITIVCAALLAAPFLIAQEAQEGGAAGAPPMGNPKTAAHEPLATLVGTWTISGRMEAMPGVPGMEQPATWTGTEHAALCCNGLWLKCLADGKCGDQVMQSLWLTGYDPKAAKYRGIWVGNNDDPYLECEGSYDAATKTWTYDGASPQGAFRSVMVADRDGHTVETCYLLGEDGKQTEFMRIERTRTGAAAPVDASAAMPKPTAEQIALLAASVGDWDVVTTVPAPGQGDVEDTGTERVRPICGGKWFWSDFDGRMMGRPFEGHSLMGYDPTRQKYVGVWLDSMSPTHALTWGTYDAGKKQWSFAGECIDMAGNTAQIDETYRHTDADTRDLEIAFTSKAGTQTMRMHYTRKPK
jgi:hypothetical protein